MSPPSHRVAVVILNWNGRVFLEKFLPDVVRYSIDFANVIVADNASTDDSIAFLQKNFPQVQIIQHKSNKGYTGGYNEALSQIDSEYYVLLNSDVEVSRNWIQPVIELMDRTPAAAACQPKILSYHQRDMFEFAGAGGGFIDMYGYPFCRGRIFQHLEKDTGQYNDSREIFWATGACLFVRSAAFRAVGGFDDYFFAHQEEIDLCWRFHRAAYQVWYCGSSAIYHVGGGTLPKNNPRKTYFNFRNNLLMLYKNADPAKWLGILVFRTIFDFIAALTFIFTSGIKDSISVLRAHIDFHRNKLQYKASRENKVGVNFSKRLIYHHSLLFAYYLRRREKFSELKDLDH